MKLLQNAGFYHPDIRNLHELVHLAKELHGLGSQYVLLKGDHLPLHENLEAPRGELDKQMVVDVFYDGKDVRLHGATCITTGGPQGDRYALACTLSIPEAMVSSNNERPQLQSLRISPLGTPCR